MERTLPIRTSMWQAIGASAPGSSHIERNEPCQDYCHICACSGDTLILAVADGAGSARFADQGARIAVQSASEHLSHFFASGESPLSKQEWEVAFREALVAAVDAIACAALSPSIGSERQPVKDCVPDDRKSDVSTRDFATTLLLVVATPRQLATAQIGDGAVVVEKMNGELSLLSEPIRLERINETHFLTDRHMEDHLITTSVMEAMEVKSVAVMTDGLQFLAFDVACSEPFRPFFQPLFSFASSQSASSDELLAFLQSDRVQARTDDDLTLILATRL